MIIKAKKIAISLVVSFSKCIEKSRLYCSLASECAYKRTIETVKPYLKKRDVFLMSLRNTADPDCFVLGSGVF